MNAANRPNLDEPRESTTDIYKYDVLDHGFVSLMNIAT